MIPSDDMAACAEAIRHGSRSFYVASRLLPGEIRDPALALYAFCRLADDEVDLKASKAASVLALHERLDAAYAGKPFNASSDRAFAAVIEAFEMPRALPEALLEGLAWDAMEKRYATLGELHSYSARVAAAVGAMMCVLMRVRDRHALARACDLGVAMQLTNIARDVGEDAREGRLYLPLEWLAEVGLDPEGILALPVNTPELALLTHRLLRVAQRLYGQSEAGIALLPRRARPGIYAARHIYAGIGGAIERAGYDSVNSRAHTNTAQKLGWLMLSLARTGVSMMMPRSAMIYARPLPQTAFLVNAAARGAPLHDHWSENVLSVMATLKARDLERMETLSIEARRVTPV
ncbi:MAG: phytoene/squalene synthase family protein [Pseudomonadota bacterium]